MIINASSVAMMSERSYQGFRQEEKLELVHRQDEAVKLNISKESKSLVQQMKDYQLSLENQKKEQEKANVQNMLESHRAHKSNQSMAVPENEHGSELEMLKKLLEALRRAIKGGRPESFKQEADHIKAEYSNSFSLSKSSSASANIRVLTGEPVNLSSGERTFQMERTTVTSGFFMETEMTAFKSTGFAKTSDGREISFDVTLEMSRGFCEKYVTFAQEEYICVDPLVINVDSNVAKMSDMKFLFDIDADGKEDEISFAKEGSGFITLDKNNDGRVNDGSELFGTKSGDGFKDLAAYDEDGNGWIDEADSVFDDLKIWMKDENGNDIFIKLKDADVGAIYLGNADTEFSLKNLENGDTDGVIRKTGIYLKESGGVGTVQHVDLAV